MDTFKNFLKKIFAFATIDESAANKTLGIGQHNYKDPIANRSIDPRKQDLSSPKAPIVTQAEVLQQKTTILKPVGLKNKENASMQTRAISTKQDLNKNNLNIATTSRQEPILRDKIGNQSRVNSNSNALGNSANAGYSSKLQFKDKYSSGNVISSKDSKVQSDNTNAMSHTSKEQKAKEFVQNILTIEKAKQQSNKADNKVNKKDKEITSTKKAAPVASKSTKITKEIKEIIWEGDAIEVEFTYMARDLKIRTNALIKRIEKLKDGSFNLTGKCKASGINHKVFCSKDIITKLVVPGCKNRLTINEWAKYLVKECEMA